MSRLNALSLIALAVAVPVAAQQAMPADRDIVVTARTLEDTATALAACIARSCPPDQDIAATLAHAENQFIAGDYRDARGTMLASIGRNRNETARFPVEVSGLYRANARVAAHLGEGRAYQLSVLEMRDALADGLSAGDPRLLAAQIEVADSRARLGYPAEARRAYIDIARDAERLNVPRVAAFARIRLAIVDLPKERTERRRDREEAARASLLAIAEQPATVGADLALLAEVLLARVERDDGNMARTQRLVERFAAGNGARRPLLVSGDPIRLPDADREEPEGRSQNVLSRNQTYNVENRWIDVGYWINADGRVSDYEILRSSGALGWADAVERSIESRVYSPLRSEQAAGAPGFYVVERYTLTADYDADGCTGTRLRCRSQRLRVERIDLTPEDLAAQPARNS